MAILLTILPSILLLPIMLINNKSRLKVYSFLSSIFITLTSLAIYSFADRSYNNIVSFEITSIGFVDFGYDRMSLLFILLTSFISTCVVMDWIKSIKSGEKLYISLVFLLQQILVIFFLSQDIISFYVFFEATLVPIFFMIYLYGGDDRVYASMKIMLYTIFGSLIMLISLIYVAIIASNSIGHATMSIKEISSALLSIELSNGISSFLFVSIFIGLAIKIPMVPFHSWLPSAHVEAPTGGSMFLAGVLIKIGAYGMLKILIPFLPKCAQNYSEIIMLISCVIMIYASFISFMQKNIKKMIAYSSIAHMGYVTAGIFSLTKAGIDGAIFQMISHGIVSSGLFLGIGMIYERTHTKDIDKNGHLAHHMPVFSIAFIVLVFASIGLPGTSGFIGELLVVTSSYKISLLVCVMLASGCVFGATYMLYLAKKIMFDPLHESDYEVNHHEECDQKNDVRHQNEETHVINDIDFIERINIYSLAIVSIIIGIFPSFILNGIIINFVI